MEMAMNELTAEHRYLGLRAGCCCDKASRFCQTQHTPLCFCTAALCMIEKTHDNQQHPIKGSFH